MAEELTGLNKSNFTRRSFCRTRPTKLFVFFDASPQAYGFVIYGVYDGISQINFAKTKVAPVKSKSLPTLELLAVFIAFKDLRFEVRGYSDAVITDIYIFFDAQVVLSWLLKDNIKIKYIFAGSRVKDINDMKNQIEKNSDFRIKYKYVYTTDNSADLISKGIIIAKFENVYEFWSHEPHWVIKDEKEWPTSRLECLSTESKNTVSSKIYYNIIESYVEPVVSLSKFSSWKKLTKVTSLAYKFLYNCKRKDQTDHLQPIKLYLIKTMQKESFCRELSFSKDSTKSKIPSLVKNLNVFLNQEGILRMDGKITSSKR